MSRPTAKTTNLARFGPAILAGGVLLGVGYAYMANRPPTVAGTEPASIMRTPGVRNVENAYKRGGATSTHTKAYGGTEQGSKSDVLKEGGGTGKPYGFDHEHMGEEQRPVQSTAIEKEWSKMHYGSEKGK